MGHTETVFGESSKRWSATLDLQGQQHGTHGSRSWGIVVRGVIKWDFSSSCGVKMLLSSKRSEFTEALPHLTKSTRTIFFTTVRLSSEYNHASRSRIILEWTMSSRGFWCRNSNPFVSTDGLSRSIRSWIVCQCMCFFQIKFKIWGNGWIDQKES